QSPQLAIDVEIAHVGANEMERLRLRADGAIGRGLGALRRTRERGALRNDAEQRQVVDLLKLLRLADAPIEPLGEERDAEAQQEAESRSENRVPARLRRGQRRRRRCGLCDLHVARAQFGEYPQRLSAALQGYPCRA